MTRRRPTIAPGDGDPRHGTANGYCNLSCRCGWCRAAWTGYLTARRHTRRLPLLTDGGPR